MGRWWLKEVNGQKKDWPKGGREVDIDGGKEKGRLIGGGRLAEGRREVDGRRNVGGREEVQGQKQDWRKGD